MDPRDFFAPGWGNIVCEVPDGKVGELSITYTVIGEVTGTGALEYGNVSIPLDEALSAWNRPLEDVFPTETGVEKKSLDIPAYSTDKVYICLLYTSRCV